jgi:VWFA-related protein
LICFADKQVVWVTDLTHDRERFLQRLDVQEGFGQTALHDAVAAAPGLVDQSVQGRKAIVLITDGVDNFSQLDPADAVALARRVNVPIYTIGFLSVPPSMLPKATVGARLETLGKFSEETGGWIFPVYDPAELKEAVAALDSELRYQYLIGYHPVVGLKSSDPGKFRRVRLEVAQRRATVRTRSGYFAEP